MIVKVAYLALGHECLGALIVIHTVTNSAGALLAQISYPQQRVSVKSGL